MKYLLYTILFLGILPTKTFAKKKKTIKSVTISTNYETPKLGGLLGNNDCVLFNDSANNNIIFSATPQGIYTLSDSAIQILKGRFGAIDVQNVFCNKSCIIATSIKGENTIRIYTWNSNDKSASEISAGDIPSGVDDIIGIKIITGNTNSADKMIVLGKRGQIEVWELFVLSWGQIDAKVIETTTLPERCNSFTIFNNNLAGTYEKSGFWVLPLQENGKLGNVKNYNSKSLKFPLSGITQFTYKNDKYFAFTQRDSSFMYLMNIKTGLYSPALKIYHESDKKYVQNPIFILTAKSPSKEDSSIYIFDYQNTKDGKSDGMNFKVLKLDELDLFFKKMSK